MQSAFYRQHGQRYETVVPNAFLGSFEMDLAAIRKSGLLEEIEIKTTTSDLKKDFDKQSRGGTLKHDQLKAGKMPCNYFSFLVPEGMAFDSIPEYAGIYTCVEKKWGFRVTTIRPPRLLHKAKVGAETKYQLARKMVFRYWQGGEP